MDYTLQTKTQTIALEKEMGAIEIQDDGVALAHISLPSSEKPKLLHCDFFPHNNINELGTTLEKITGKYNLKEIHFNWVLHPKYYRLLLIDIPAEVPQSEYKEAAKWQIKDIVDYPLDDIAIETFESEDLQKRGIQKLYIAATQRSFLQKTLEIINPHLPNIVAVDIREFALRNLVKLAHQPTSSEETTAHLFANNEESLLIITQQNILNFARRIPLGLSIIKGQEEVNNLVNEIQRSLDYYHTTFKGNKPGFFLIYPPLEISGLEKSVLDCIAENLAPTQVQHADLKTIVNTADLPHLNNELEKQCYIALGGALRNMEKD